MLGRASEMLPNLSCSNKNLHPEAPTHHTRDWHLFVPEPAAETCGHHGLKATRAFLSGADCEARGSGNEQKLWPTEQNIASVLHIRKSQEVMHFPSRSFPF